MAKDRFANTSTRVGGSGGIAYSCVKSITLNGSHLLPLENISKTVDEALCWISNKIQEWKCLMDKGKGKWVHSTLWERQTFSAGFRESLLKEPTAQRSLNNKL